ncbi:hypothetical protein QAD02_012187 [Eretmocerus hayati]|uniref:Uncharacterized protein n=1 Tax=Eretmocerus hayati TaxID=131215 RepID=A0ACC2NYX8_9HYME|nr:hypothetical protein QAD02_012187 [Eretmocerus hayati]
MCRNSAIGLILLLLPAGLVNTKLDSNPDIQLKTDELAKRYGYPFEEHKVITDDGYILGLHRIPFGRSNYRNQFGGRPPVLLMHGLGGSSADWILMGPGYSLAYLLADGGYDVWLGNNRGNVYSRNHSTMEPSHRYFWDFSFHELGVYDLPAMVDHILRVTRRRSLQYVGHSQGTTQFLVMTSQRPSYNSKISLATGLAPAAFTGYMRGPITQLTKLAYFGVWVGENFGYPEFAQRSRWGRFVSSLFCQSAAPTQAFCSTKFYLLAGFSPDIDLDKLPVILGHVPAGASWKQLIHYGQGYINPGYFRLFDYGDIKKNYQIYGSPSPPEYQLSTITVPVALFSSTSDFLTTPKVEQYHLSSRDLNEPVQPLRFSLGKNRSTTRFRASDAANGEIPISPVMTKNIQKNTAESCCYQTVLVNVEVNLLRVKFDLASFLCSRVKIFQLTSALTLRRLL